MTTTEIRRKLVHEPDYVFLKRFDFSLAKLVEKYPEGVPDRVIAQGLLLTEEDVREIYEHIVLKLRRTMRINL